MAGSMSGAARKTSFTFILGLLLVGALALRIGAALYTAGDTELTVWADRDLWRALMLDGQWPVYGPEINGGLRPPGGAFYLLLGAVLAIAPSFAAAHLALIVLFAASLLLVAVVFAREVSLEAGILCASAVAGSTMLAEVLSVWNPGYLLFFATAATVFGYRFLRTGGTAPLAIATAALAIGLQIHTQIFLLAAALAVATAICRPPLTWRHALTVVLAFALPYLPTLLAGGWGSILSASAVPSGAVDNYVLGGFPLAEKLALIYGLLGGDWRPAGFAVPQGIIILKLAADGLAAVAALGFLGWFARGHMRDAAGRPIGVFALIALGAVGIALVSTVNGRHMVAALPAVAIMTGLAAEAALRRLGRRPAGLAAAGAVLACLLVLRPAALGALTLLPAPFSPGSIAAQSEIAATAKAAFYGDREAFESHAALFTRSPSRNWQLAQNGVAGQMAFLYLTAPATPAAVQRAECLAIVPKSDLAGDVRSDLAKSAPFSGLPATFAPMAAESEHFAYFPYTTADGNCLKSFPNAYLPSRIETVLATGQSATEADHALFTGSIAGEAFPLGVELSRSGSAYTAVLHGRLLRGYTGLRFLTMINPILCVAGGTGVQVVPLAHLAVGSPQRGALAPWRSPRFDLADGRYRLWLVGRDGKTPTVVQMALGGLAVPQMTATPAADGGEAPPTGCPVPALGPTAAHK